MSYKDPEKRREWQRAYRAKNYAAVRAGEKERHARRNPVKVKAAHRAHYVANKERHIAQSREWRRKNPDKARASTRRYWVKNKDKHRLAVQTSANLRCLLEGPRKRENNAAWREANRERLRQYLRRWRAQKKQESLNAI